MHGRLKVRSTAEQAEAKRVERQKKLRVYQNITSHINEKRQSEELDEEALSLTGQLLVVNPDFYTLWNYRREILKHLKKERETLVIQELCVKELSFLESCLPINPKSYGIWHHRSWTMMFMPQPDWERELKLCNVYLVHDERNFHCWDYRRFVVDHANISAQEEFEFTSNKINENFSNYSSWHYRSKLLPKIHPYSTGNSERIEEKALLKEFELVQNAFFTDPNDQSAWFYHRWLLGRAKDDLGILLSYVRRCNGQIFLYLLFNQPVKLEKLLPVVLRINDSDEQDDWFNSLKNCQPSHLWSNFLNYTKITKRNTAVEKLNISISCEKLEFSVSIPLEPDEQETWRRFSDQLQYVFRSELTAVHNSFLQNELESCQLLLEEEPLNKWTMLTIVLLMRAINPMKYTQQVEVHLGRLSDVDPYRCEYYNDLNSKYKLENAIENHLIKFKDIKSEKSRSIDLTNMNLSSLYHMEQLLLMTEIDLSQNKLPKLDDCNMLQCARTLIVNDNRLVTVAKQGMLNLPYLEILSLKNNAISSVSCLQALQQCQNLQQLHVDNNPVTTLPNWKQEVQSLLPWLRQLNGEIF